MTETKIVSAYKLDITLKKFLYGLLYAVAPVILIYVAEYLQTNSTDFPIEFAVFIPLVVGFLTALANYIKHRNDTQEVPA